MFNFQSKYTSLVVWLGNKKLKFKRGMFHTEDKAVADFLRKHKDCTELVHEIKNAKASVVVELKEKPAKKSSGKSK